MPELDNTHTASTDPRKEELASLSRQWEAAGASEAGGARRDTGIWLRAGATLVSIAVAALVMGLTARSMAFWAEPGNPHDLGDLRDTGADPAEALARAGDNSHVTVSGLVPIATVLGMLVSSLLTGWLVSRSGRYRLYPVAGTALAALGLTAMGLLPAGMPLWVPMIVMAAVGIGTGAFTNLIFAVVQSAASRDDLGAVTATTNLVRQIGAAVGTAVVGGIIGVAVAAGLPAGVDAATLTPGAARAAAPAVQEQIGTVYHDAFAPVFLGLAVVYACGVAIALLLPAARLSVETPAPAASVPARQSA